MEFAQRLRLLLLEGAFADPEVSLESTRSGRVGGFLVSDDFAAIPQVDRQALLWGFLESRLDKVELGQIVSILTLTRAELREAS